MLPMLLTAGLLLASSGPRPPAETRAFPTFVLVRGGDLKEPVLIHHGALRLPGRPGDVSCSPLATLMLARDDSRALDAGAGTLVYEVAEFWGQRGIADTSGRPHAPLQWNGASQYSEIHVTAGGDVRWHTLDGAFRGGRSAVQQLRPAAVAVLAESGVTLPPSVPRPAGVKATPSGCR